MDFVQLNIAAIRQSDSQNNVYVLLLNETVGERQLPIVIGWCEATCCEVDWREEAGGGEEVEERTRNINKKRN